jgi:uncharacterized membrane protein
MTKNFPMPDYFSPQAVREYPMHKQNDRRELAFSRSWTGTYIPPSIMRQVAIQPLLSPKRMRMAKKTRSVKRGDQEPRLETLQAQKRGQKITRRETSVLRILGLTTVKCRGDIPGNARPIKSAELNSRK